MKPTFIEPNGFYQPALILQRAADQFIGSLSAPWWPHMLTVCLLLPTISENVGENSQTDILESKALIISINYFWKLIKCHTNNPKWKIKSAITALHCGNKYTRLVCCLLRVFHQINISSWNIWHTAELAYVHTAYYILSLGHISIHS